MGVGVLREKQTKDNIKHMNIKVPVDLYEKMELMAMLSERTISGQVRYMLQEYIRIKES
jgi:hypothetical protein